MKKQEIRSFGEAFNGKTPSKEEQRNSGQPILKIRDIDEVGQFRGRFESFVDSKFYDRHSKKKLHAGDTIILNAAHNTDYVGGKNAFVPDELHGVIATGEWLVVRVKDANSRYVNQYLKSPPGRKSLKNCVKGIHLYPKDVERISVPLPSLDDQTRIAHLLGKVEGLIAQRKQHLQQLDDLLKSVFLEMFGDQINTGRNSTLGAYIAVLTDYHANGSYETLKDNVELLTEPNYALMVRTTDLENKKFSDGCIYINREAYDFLEKSKVYGGEIIINKIGSAGKVYLMPNLDRPVSLGMNSFLLRFNEGLNNIFAYHFLTSDVGTQRIQKHVKGAVTKTITKDAIRSIAFPIISIDHQKKFAITAEKVESIKVSYQKSLTDLESLYGALSQQAFKGELDLSRVHLPGTQPEEKKVVTVEPQDR